MLRTAGPALAAVLAVATSAPAQAAAHPSFGGTWVIDAAHFTSGLAATSRGDTSLRTLPERHGVTAFVDVSVVPMDRERVLAHQTVVVRDGRIAAIGAAGAVPVPAGARRIDGRGRWLMPGLVDMHAHFLPGTEDLADGAGRQLALYLATGFTTVRGLGGAMPNALGLRDRIAAGAVLGPSLVVASPSINGQSARTPAEAAQKVDAAKRAGYDLIKTHGMFPSVEFYDSLVAGVRRTGLPLAGHVTPEYGLRRAIDAGQEIEHLDGYIAEMLADGVSAPPGGQIVADAELLARVDPAKLQAIVAETVRRGIWNGPTLALFRIITSDDTPDALSQADELRYATPASVQAYRQQKAGARSQLPDDGRRQFVELRDRLVRALHDAGAKLLVGSDSPQFFLLPGFGALAELDAFVTAGLTPYAALEAATRNPAEYLGRLTESGTVAVGKRADLLLLDADPLADVRNVRAVRGVMADGRWLDDARLGALRASVAALASALAAGAR